MDGGSLSLVVQQSTTHAPTAQENRPDLAAE
jgi:hypothetical protein